ncbi:hypothetical protein [Bacillus subtilis]|nr:hypothetical protein [Bacillus subtilis]
MFEEWMDEEIFGMDLVGDGMRLRLDYGDEVDMGREYLQKGEL